jgi:hypothetical protein
MTVTSDDRLVRYLLDEASEDERAAVERELLADDDRYQELEAAEDELRHDYLRGALSPAQRARFEARFLATPAGRGELERARDVLAAVDRAAAPRPRASAPATRWLAAAAVLSVCVAGWSALEARRARAVATDLAAGRSAAEGEWTRRLAEETERAEALARELRAEQGRRAVLEQALGRLGDAVGAARAIVAATLSPGLVRGAGLATVVLPRDTDLRLSLRLPPGLDATALQASLHTADGVFLWSRRGLVPRAGGPDRVVVVTLPGRLLGAGEYEVVLATDVPAGDEVADYHFAVSVR